MTARGIDHLVLCVEDLPAARQRYQALGFTTTPIAVHPFGTSNSLVQFDGNFIELLAITHPERIAPAAPGQFGFARFVQRYLAQREGMAMLVFASRDARADQREFSDKGLTTYAPFDFSRQSRLPDGSEVTVAFSLAFVTHEQMPEAAFFCCQQHAPESFWQADYQRHGNSAKAISEVMMVAEQPARFAGFFAALQEGQPIAADDDALSVTTAFGRISVASETRYRARFSASDRYNKRPDSPHFAAYQIAVEDLHQVQKQLQRAKIDHFTGQSAIQVPADQAFGVGIEFTPVGSTSVNQLA